MSQFRGDRNHKNWQLSPVTEAFCELPGERPFIWRCATPAARVRSRATASTALEQVCSGPSKTNRLRMIPPLVVTCISPDGVARSAKIETVAARVTMQ